LELKFGKQIVSVSKFGPLHLQYVCSLSGDNKVEGIVVQNPNRKGQAIVRVHSSCVFSEALLAIDCDCSRQLELAIADLARDGGVIIYVIEEGRGIGLELKFEAVAKQQSQNISTADAFAQLGFPSDPRTMSFPAAVIKNLFGDTPVTILTNNLHKLSQLKKLGVNLGEYKRHQVNLTPELIGYLKDKRDSLGHQIEIEE
jgi:GTP cyclohydrolase II